MLSFQSVVDRHANKIWIGSVVLCCLIPPMLLPFAGYAAGGLLLWWMFFVACAVVLRFVSEGLRARILLGWWAFYLVMVAWGVLERWYWASQGW